MHARRKTPVFIVTLAMGASACAGRAVDDPIPAVLDTTPRIPPEVLRMPGEVRLDGLRQLSDHGSALALSVDPMGTQIATLADRSTTPCAQPFVMGADGRDDRLVGPGTGATLDVHLSPDAARLFFTSTHASAPSCPTSPKQARAGVPLHADADIFVRALNSATIAPLIAHPGFDGEVGLSGDGAHMVFTSMRTGDPELFTAKADGTDVRRVTERPGYDGQGALDHTGRMLVHVMAPAPKSEVAVQRLVHPTSGSSLVLRDLERPDAPPITLLAGGQPRHPVFTPGDTQVVFSATLDGARELYVLDIASGALERLTYHPGTDDHPQFAMGGRVLVFRSARNGAASDASNVFRAEWSASTPSPEGALTGAARIEESTLRQRVETLSSPDFAGRAPGTAGLDAAKAYVSKQFEMIGLKPSALPGATGYSVPFELELGFVTSTVDMRMGRTRLRPGASMQVASVSGFGSAELPVYFFAQGDDLAPYDEAAERFPDGYVALMHVGTDRPGRASRIGALDINKAIRAANEGARAVVLIADALDTEPDEVARAPIPVLRITRKKAVEFFGEEVETRHHSPKPLEAKLALTVEGAAKTIRASNLVGVLPASPGAAPTEEIIVLGAHLDHVGMGGALSMSKEDALHPGADDNASGVAGVLEVAEALAATPGRTRDVYVVAFDAEEPGLYGSSALVEVLAREGTPTPVFMLNMDMLGRPERAEVRVDGVYSGHGLAESVRRAQTGLVVHPLLVRGAPVGSDHLSFLQQKIPVLSLHTGQHDDYHTPRDTADQIDIAGLKQVVTLGFRLARDVVRRQRRVVWR